MPDEILPITAQLYEVCEFCLFWWSLQDSYLLEYLFCIQFIYSPYKVYNYSYRIIKNLKDKLYC